MGCEACICGPIWPDGDKHKAAGQEEVSAEWEKTKPPLSMRPKERKPNHPRGKLMLRRLANKINSQRMTSLPTKCKNWEQSHTGFTIGMFKTLEEVMQEHFLKNQKIMKHNRSVPPDKDPEKVPKQRMLSVWLRVPIENIPPAQPTTWIKLSSPPGMLQPSPHAVPSPAQNGSLAIKRTISKNHSWPSGAKFHLIDFFFSWQENLKAFTPLLTTWMF